MAKKKADPAPETKTDANAESKTKRKSEYSYSLGEKSLDKDTKVPTQMRQIVELIVEAGGNISRADLLEKMKSKITTRQPIDRILGFYQSRMLRDGFVKVSAPEGGEPAKDAKAA